MSTIVTLHYNPARYRQATQTRPQTTYPAPNEAAEKSVSEALERMRNYQPQFTRINGNAGLEYDTLADDQWMQDNHTVCDRLSFLRETYKAIQLIKRKGYKEAHLAAATSVEPVSRRPTPTPEFMSRVKDDGVPTELSE